MTDTPTLHATAVLIGAKAVLIRGPSGSGKSRLVWDLLEAASRGTLPFARLVADDRLHLDARHGRLIVRPAAALAGLLEMRGLGIRRLPYEPVAVVGVVVDLDAADGSRLPPISARMVEIAGIRLPRLPIAAGAPALPPLLAILSSSESTD